MQKPEWPEFYEAVADKLLTFSKRPAELFDLISRFASTEPLLHYLHLAESSFWEGRELDPFTVLGIFNRHTTDAHRHNLAKGLADMLGVTGVNPPEIFHGIPFLDPRNSIYQGGAAIWKLFTSAIQNVYSSQEFISSFTVAVNIKGNALSGLSMALYWTRPYAYMPVDRISEPYLTGHYKISIPGSKADGRQYSDFLAELQKAADISFPEIALAAWQSAHAS